MSRRVPADEMLLAEAIAAAKARGLKWCAWSAFKKDERVCEPEDADSCCVLGALHLAGVVPMFDHSLILNQDTRCAPDGNDLNWNWHPRLADDGESLGWAFRCAMTDGDS